MGFVKNLCSPETVKPFITNIDEKIIQISVGQNHSVALSDHGKVYSCGSSQYG